MGCRYICNYRECDPEKGGLAWGIIAEDLSGFCRSQHIANHLAVGIQWGATVLTIAAAVFGMEPRAMILIEADFPAGRILLDESQCKKIIHWLPSR